MVKGIFFTLWKESKAIHMKDKKVCLKITYFIITL